MYVSFLRRIGRIAIVWNRVYTYVNRTVILWHLGVCRTWGQSRTFPYDLYTTLPTLIRLGSLVEWVDFTHGCIYCLIRSHTISYGFVRSLIRSYTVMTPVNVYFKVLKIIHGLHGPIVTRLTPRFVRLYVRFTRLAIRISRVFCVRRALMTLWSVP
jgi:hypothetical protein